MLNITISISLLGKKIETYLILNIQLHCLLFTSKSIEKLSEVLLDDVNKNK